MGWGGGFTFSLGRFLGGTGAGTGFVGRLLDDGLRRLRYLRHQLGSGDSLVSTQWRSLVGAAREEEAELPYLPDVLAVVAEFAQKTLRSAALSSRLISCRSFWASCFKLGFICQVTIP